MYPEIILDTIENYPEDISKLEGKNLLLYDTHHGTAYQLNNAKADDIERLIGNIFPYCITIELESKK